jgi:hypothetical protein
MLDAVNKSPFFTNIANAFKTAYHTIAADFIVITLIVSHLIKGAQGVGLFSITSEAVKSALATVSAVGHAFESLKATVEASTLFTARKRLFEHVKLDPSLSEEQRIDNLHNACLHIKDNSKTIHKTLKIVKSVKLGERATKILDGLKSEDESTRAEALKNGEQFVKVIHRRINTQFGFALANIVTRVSGLAISIVLIVTAANPVTLTLTGVVGLGILVVIAGQKVMIPENPFDAPDPDKKFLTAIYKIREAVFRGADRIEAFFHRPRCYQGLSCS